MLLTLAHALPSRIELTSFELAEPKLTTCCVVWIWSRYHNLYPQLGEDRFHQLCTMICSTIYLHDGIAPPVWSITIQAFAQVDNEFRECELICVGLW